MVNGVQRGKDQTTTEVPTNSLTNFFPILSICVGAFFTPHHCCPFKEVRSNF